MQHSAIPRGTSCAVKKCDRVGVYYPTVKLWLLGEPRGAQPPRTFMPKLAPFCRQCANRYARQWFLRDFEEHANKLPADFQRDLERFNKSRPAFDPMRIPACHFIPKTSEGQ
jgi:hypothetical protein